MNEFDPKQDDMSRSDPLPQGDSLSQSDSRTQDDSSSFTHTDTPEEPAAPDTHSTQASADGRSYTNPDGTHGYIYNAETGKEGKVRGYRGALIAVSAILATILLGVCCLLGAWKAARSLHDDHEPSGDRDKAEVGTSGGLYIVGDDAEAGDRGPAIIDEGSHVIPLGSETVPSNATIEKPAPERADANKDGKADIAYDENGEVITSAGKNATTAATVVARVSASVVEITTETITQSGFLGQYVTSGAGSGVIISKEGFIVTNHHVIADANSITVRLNDGTEYAAALVGSDAETDVAVLWINAAETDLTVATLGSSFDLVVGEDILAIGNPLGSLGGTVTEGMVSATARQITVSGSSMTLLQVSAPINPGNSGGGLFNFAGELVGVVNAKVSSEDIEGLGFAIPIDTAYEIILQLVEHGYVRGRPTMNVTVVDATQQAARQYFGSSVAGVYVYDDDHTVLEYGDRITAVGDKEIGTCDELRTVIRTYAVGDTVGVELYRNGRRKTVSIVLAESLPDNAS